MQSKKVQVKHCMCIHHRQSTFNAASGITLKQTPVSQVCNHKSINLHHIQYMNLDCFELYWLSYNILLSNYDLQSQLCLVLASQFHGLVHTCATIATHTHIQSETMWTVQPSFWNLGHSYAVTRCNREMEQQWWEPWAPTSTSDILS